MRKFEDDILSFIPQRAPFVMVDKILSSDATKTSSSFIIKEGNVFLENGFFKEPGLLENIAQTAAARAGSISKIENKPVDVGYIGAVKNFKIFSLPTIGDELLTEITIENQIFDVTLISGKILCNNIEIAYCEMKIFINITKSTSL